MNRHQRGGDSGEELHSADGGLSEHQQHQHAQPQQYRARCAYRQQPKTTSSEECACTSVVISILSRGTVR
jgi:hypothetical protein